MLSEKARIQKLKKETARLSLILQQLQKAPFHAFNYNGDMLFIKKNRKFYHIEIPDMPHDMCIFCNQKKATQAHHLIPKRVHVKNPILKELRANICDECNEKAHPENLVDADGIIARQNRHIIKLEKDNRSLRIRKDDIIIQFIEDRIAKLERDVKQLTQQLKKHPRRIHPAHKQMEGRIMELKYLHKHYRRILNKSDINDRNN